MVVEEIGHFCVTEDTLTSELHLVHRFVVEFHGKLPMCITNKGYTVQDKLHKCIYRVKEEC